MGKPMHITKACDYALQAMVYLAGRDSRPVETARIAADTNVPPVYLRKILQSLGRSGLVKTYAGAGGGVALMGDSSNITLKDIIEAVEGPIMLSDCIKHPDSCGHSPACRITACLADVERRLKEDLASRTLADLV